MEQKLSPRKNFRCEQVAVIMIPLCDRIWPLQKAKFHAKLQLRCDKISNCQRYDFGHTLLRYQSLTYMFIKPTPEAPSLHKSLAPDLGVAKFATARDMILVTLCCAPKVTLRCSTNPLKTFLKCPQPANNNS